MQDVFQRDRGGKYLWLSLALFAFFGVQILYQVLQAHLRGMEVNADLSAELAEAMLVEEKPAPASAGWPRWRGPHGDGAVHAPDLLLDWPDKGPPLVWQKNIGDGYSSFAVQDGRAYTQFAEAGREGVVCWRVKDGKELWRYAYDCSFVPQEGPGPRATPSVDGDRVYTIGSGGTLLCLDAVSGSLHWRRDLMEEFHTSPPKWGIAASPLIDGDLVFVNPGGGNGHSVAAFHKISGEPAWQNLDDPAGYATPVAVTIADTRQILFFTGDSLVGVRANDGKLCWRFPWNTKFDVNAATPLVIPARKGDRLLTYVFISSGYDRGCALVKISGSTAGDFTAQMVYEGKQLRSHFASPVRHDEYLYGIDDAQLICMDVRTGQVKWKRAGVNKGSLLLADDHLLVLSEIGKLTLVKATPEEYEEKAEAWPFGQRSRERRRCWTMPVLADGRLFLRSENRVKCLDVRKN